MLLFIYSCCLFCLFSSYPILYLAIHVLILSLLPAFVLISSLLCHSLVLLPPHRHCEERSNLLSRNHPLHYYEIASSFLLATTTFLFRLLHHYCLRLYFYLSFVLLCCFFYCCFLACCFLSFSILCLYLS